MKDETAFALLTVLVIASAGAGYYVGSTSRSATTSTFTTTSFMTRSGYTYTSTTTVTTTCSGYPPGGDCVTTYSYTFTISVNYTGPWKLTYQGNNVSGNNAGSGFFSKAVTLSDLNTKWLTLCATAQKLDGSYKTLTLTVTGHNETSLPYGVTSYCGGVVP